MQESSKINGNIKIKYLTRKNTPFSKVEIINKNKKKSNLDCGGEHAPEAQARMVFHSLTLNT